MEISKLTLSKDTQDKMKKPMSVRKKGKELFSRLQELDADGTLSKAKTRADVAKLVGYSEERAKAGYSWVSNLINRGHVSETIREWTPSGKTIAEYHTTGSLPDYGYEEVNRRRKKKAEIAEEWVKQQQNMPVLAECKPIKIEITRGDTSIKVEMDDYEQINKLITTILKG